MTEPTDVPVEPAKFYEGDEAKVVDIGNMRITRGMTRRPRSSCRHMNIVYDATERRVWCCDCETDVQPFDALVQIAEYFHGEKAMLKRREHEVEQVEKFKARSIAAKAVDVIWRSGKFLPSCPHCHQGLFPEDFKGERTKIIGREFAEARRRAAENKAE